MVYTQPGIYPGEWDVETLLGFWDTNRSANLAQTTRPYNNQQKKKKKRTCNIVDLAVPLDHTKIERKRNRKISTWTLVGNWKICET